MNAYLSSTAQRVQEQVVLFTEKINTSHCGSDMTPESVSTKSSYIPSKPVGNLGSNDIKNMRSRSLFS
ncbi:unnamed protein product [Litomosoides sigmodontis]|uniref:Uncharacterized protein n=1 Tax=Litomosoides sigmodontis TaxID=42156 RepID=A0A3P6UX20_LITSI|nr:unnamed protein product [Litomosoides sigmodontis]